MSANFGKKCPTRDLLEALVHGSLTDADARNLEAHVDECDSCRHTLDDISGIGEFDGSDLTSTLDDGSQQAIEELAKALKEPSAPVDATMPEQQRYHDANAAGQIIGIYEVIEEIARGGMGVVLKAWDPNLQRAVAIKQLAPHLAVDKGARERFIQEARAAAALDHENILPIYAVEPDPDVPYLVMPFVEGESLQQVIDGEGPLSNDEVAAIGMKIAAGLQYAHDHNVIHRDLKPANIMLDAERRRVWIADFGLARVGDHSGTTQTGVLAGTPSFMAPEQIEDRPVDHRADLFSFGVTLYAMATGKAPFLGSSVAALLRQVVESPVPPARSENEKLDPALDRVIGRLLEKDPDQRFQSAGAVRRALVRDSGGSASFVEKPKPARTRRAVLIAALAGVAVAAAAWISYSLWSGATVPPPSASTGPFVISRGGGGGEQNAIFFPSLGKALEQCMDGGVIEVHLTGEHELEPVEFGKKDIIIRAGDAHHPVFTVTDSSKPAIATRGGRLWLEGLAFERDSARGVDYPMISAHGGGALWITNCRIAVDSGTEMTAPPPACVQVEDTTEFLLVNSSILSQRFTMVGSVNTKPLENQRIEFRNSALLGMWIMSFAHPQSSSGELVFHRNLMVGRVIFTSLSQQRITNFKFAAEKNIFDARQAIVSIERGVPKNASPNFAWRGRDNIFNAGFAYVQGMRGLRFVAGARFFEDWKAIVEEGSGSVEAEVIDRDHMFRKGGIRISDIELDKVVLALDKKKDGVPDAGPKLEWIGPGEAWRNWRESEDGKEWRKKQMEKWRDGK